MLPHRGSEAADTNPTQEDVMRKLLLSGLLLLVCSAWMAAQTSTSQSSSTPSGTSASSHTSDQSSSTSGSTMGSSSSQTSIQGCLSGSTGSYSLADNSGTTYQLQGDDSQLSKHVGQEVEVKGSESSASASPSSTSPSSSSSASTSSSTGASAGKAFNVTSVKKISSTCSSGKSK